MISLAHRTHFALWLAVVLAFGIALLEAGVYGWTLFVIAPFALGLLAASITRPASKNRATAVGAYAVLGAAFLLLLFAMEGALCIVMSLPIVLPLGCLGAWTGFRLQQWDPKPQQGAAMLILPLAAFAWDVEAPPTLFHVTTEVLVHAPPEQVWKHVISFPSSPG